MTTDAQERGAFIAALHLESAFKSRAFARIADEGNPMRYADPAVHFSSDRDAVRLRDRLAFIEALAASARGLATAPSRESANVATWRSYLPQACVAAMIKDGWHRST